MKKFFINSAEDETHGIQNQKLSFGWKMSFDWKFSFDWKIPYNLAAERRRREADTPQNSESCEMWDILDKARTFFENR
jgi:hypothetical protein